MTAPLLLIAMGGLIQSCLNSTLESTAAFWRGKLGIPLDYQGPFK